MDKFSFLYDKKNKSKKEKEFVQEYLYIEECLPEFIEEAVVEEKPSQIIFDILGNDDVPGIDTII